MKKLCIWVQPLIEPHFVLAFDNAGETTYYDRPISVSKRLSKLVERFYESGYKISPFRGLAFGLVIERK